MTACIFKSFLKQIDLTITLLFTILCLLFVFISPLNQTPVRSVLGLPLVIFLPGYSLIAMLFPKRDDVTGIERVALSFILSAVVTPLIGLILNFTPFGIRLIPVLFVLSTFTISVSLVALVRRSKLPAEEIFRVPFERLNFNLGQSSLDKGLSIILIASIIGSYAILAFVVMTPKTGERFTELYLLGQNGTASNYPTDLKFGEEGKLIIIIVNHEYENVTYHLEVNLNGTLIHEENVSLIENEKRESHFTFQATKKGENQKLEFLLYKGQQIEAYRTLHLWINII